MRFRKSIKIAPGIKMNIGKRGVSSISAGGFNFGSRGIYHNASIPGTGISYRSQIAGRSSTAQSRSKTQKTQTKQMSITLSLFDDGTIKFFDKNGNPLPDNYVAAIKKQHRPFLENWLQQQCDQYNSLRKSLLHLHFSTPSPQGDVIVNPKPKPPKFVSHGIMSSLFSSQKQKIDEKNRLIKQEYDNKILEWRIAEIALRNDIEVMSNVIANAFSSIEWPRETLISFEINDTGDAVYLDIDLPEIEDMPTQEASMNNRNLRLSIKNLSQTQILNDYLTHIHCIGFRLIGDVFAHLPSVNTVIFSGYSQRTSKKTGHINDEYLYSVRVPRNNWQEINFKSLEMIDIVACFDLFEIRRSVTQRGIISPIEPFQS